MEENKNIKNKKINIIISYAFLVAFIVFIGFVIYQINPKHLLYTYLPLLIWGIWMWKTDII